MEDYTKYIYSGEQINNIAPSKLSYKNDKQWRKDLKQLEQDDFEGEIYKVGPQLVSALQLQADFDTLRPKHRVQIKTVATQCNEYGHSISFDQLKSHRRWCIGRGLIDLALSDNFDEDLIRSICYAVTGYIMNTAGGAVGHLEATEAEQFKTLCNHVRFDRAEITYNEDNTFTLQFPNQKASK